TVYMLYSDCSVCVPTAHTLKCMGCFGPLCSEMKCSAENNVCGAMTVTSYTGGSSNGIRIAHRSCATTHECLQGSIHFLQWRAVITTKCCKSNLCNSKDAPDPPKAAPNGHKCFSCDKEGACNKTLNCVGDEDHCVDVLVGQKTVILKGCVSKSFCLVDLRNIPALMDATMTCCQGEYCNDGNAGNSQSASLLLLATMLMYFLFI
uniref:UPAR/Ly6 domain-containing protein n=1 Tax=Periophthalmus magnuspinnatus TaxID=409849 RepID=A0A3B4ACZ3_9GOBI